MDLRTEGPLVRDLVDVVLDSWTEPLVAAVEKVGTGTLAIEAPRDRGGRVVLPEPGESGLLVWRGSRDLQQAPVSLVQTRRSPGPQWLLRLTGRQSVCQRRSFVRADVQLPVRLHVDGEQREVTALDISEGGLRASTRERDGLAGGTVVEVQLDLGGCAARRRRRGGARALPVAGAPARPGAALPRPADPRRGPAARLDLRRAAARTRQRWLTPACATRPLRPAAVRRPSGSARACAAARGPAARR